MANLRSNNEALLLDWDQPYYGATIVNQVRTPGDGCERPGTSINASAPVRDNRNKYGPLDPAPEPTGIIRPHIGEEENGEEDCIANGEEGCIANGEEGCIANGEEGCKANCESICLAISCVVDCCPHKFRLQRHIHQRSKIRRIRTEGWKLLWSVLIPLALKPLNVVWLPAQLIMALSLLVITALVTNRDSASDILLLAISSGWTLLTLIDGAVLVFNSSSIRRIFVRLFRPRNVPDEDQLTPDEESPGKYRIQGYAAVLRFLYSWFCLMPLVLVEGISVRVAGIVTNATVNQTEYQMSGIKSVDLAEYGLKIARFVITGASLLVFVEIALVVMVACVLYSVGRQLSSESHSPVCTSHQEQLLHSAFALNDRAFFALFANHFRSFDLTCPIFS